MNNAIERARKTDKYDSVLIVCVEGSADEFRGGGEACKGVKMESHPAWVKRLRMASIWTRSGHETYIERKKR